MAVKATTKLDLIAEIEAVYIGQDAKKIPILMNKIWIPVKVKYPPTTIIKVQRHPNRRSKGLYRHTIVARSWSLYAKV